MLKVCYNILSLYLEKTMHKSAIKAILILLVFSVGFGVLIYHCFTHYSTISYKNKTLKTGTFTQGNSFKSESDSNDKSSLLLELDVEETITQTQLEDLLHRTIKTIQRRIEQYGISNAKIIKEGDKFISITLPGIINMEGVESLITNNDKLEFRLVQHDADSNEALNKIYALDNPFNDNGTLKEEVQKLMPEGITVLEYKEGGYLPVANEILLSGEDLENVRVVQDTYPYIYFETTSEGAKKLGYVTGANIGRQLAIIFGNKILSAPVIRDRISKQGQISGLFEEDEAKQLAIILDTGTLPTQIKIIKRHIVIS